jgi:acetolactate decarboxylase
MKKFIFSLFFLIVLSACKTSKESEAVSEENSQLSATELHTISAMKKVMMGEDLSAHLKWDTLSKEHLYAVCPLGRIEGEVTVINGEMFTSKVVENNQIEIQHNWNIYSPFAVYAYVKEWEEIETNATFSNDDELQNFIEEIAKKTGRDVSKPFVFRITGNFDAIDYHIISKPLSETTHNHELHDQAKKHFSLQNISGQLLGFYSQHHEGVFTHRGHYIHTHFLDDKKTNMGHLENAKINNKTIKIYLSK